MKKNIPFDISASEGNGSKKKLLLHSCCAPCSSSVIEMLAQYFELTVLYYNPNIFPESEFNKRRDEQERFCREFLKDTKICFAGTDYRSEEFEKTAKGTENAPEGGERCTRCFALRLEESAKYAKENRFDFFTTTLSVSPLKDSDRLNTIGTALGKKYGVEYLVSNFKKQNGYKRSVELSKEFGMYRQDFCGCKYSLAERIMQAKAFIFDADGTLFDTMSFYENFAPNTVRAMGGEPKPELREQIRSMTVEDACRFFKKEYNLPHPVEEIQKTVSELVTKLYCEIATLKPGVFEFLQEAKKRGIKMCIATASPKEPVIQGVERLGIDDCFEFVVNCAELNTTKKESKIYEEAAKMLGADKKDAVVFEDAHHAIVTAKKGGFKVVAVREDTEKKYADIIYENSDIFVDSMLHLVQRENL
ncbi:MAG: epoxyqueuosine reductase QueH [Clostridia bacterium]|nr:epoxyqueuosine reductase QueH [Clostridia bacterium]